MNRMLAEVAFSFCQERTCEGPPRWEAFCDSVLRFCYVPLDPYLEEHTDGNFGKDYSCLPVRAPSAVVHLAPPCHSEYDSLRLVASSAHRSLCGDAFASVASARGPLKSYFMLPRPIEVVPTAAAGPLTIRDWLIRGAKVAAPPDLTASALAPLLADGLVVGGNVPHTPHAAFCMQEPWSDLTGSRPVSASG